MPGCPKALLLGNQRFSLQMQIDIAPTSLQANSSSGLRIENRTHRNLALENLALRQQLALRCLSKRPRFGSSGSDSLGAGQGARGAPHRSPRDGDSLASKGIPFIMDLEVPARAKGV